MANEITATASLSLTNGQLRFSRQTSKQINQATARYFANTQSVGTTHEALAVSADIATPGWVVFINTDPTNYVEIGIDESATFYPFIKLKAGESAMLRLGTAAPYAKANTAAVNLEYAYFAD